MPEFVSLETLKEKEKLKRFSYKKLKIINDRN